VHKLPTIYELKRIYKDFVNNLSADELNELYEALNKKYIDTLPSLEHNGFKNEFDEIDQTIKDINNILAAKYPSIKGVNMSFRCLALFDKYLNTVQQAHIYEGYLLINHSGATVALLLGDIEYLLNKIYLDYKTGAAHSEYYLLNDLIKMKWATLWGYLDGLEKFNYIDLNTYEAAGEVPPEHITLIKKFNNSLKLLNELKDDVLYLKECPFHGMLKTHAQLIFNKLQEDPETPNYYKDVEAAFNYLKEHAPGYDFVNFEFVADPGQVSQ